MGNKKKMTLLQLGRTLGKRSDFILRFADEYFNKREYIFFNNLVKHNPTYRDIEYSKKKKRKK